jgi:Zn-dependent protease with chaperone function
MRLDSADRSFAASMCVALLACAYVLCGALAGVLVPLLRARISHGGLTALPGDGRSLLALPLFVVSIAAGLALAVGSLARQALASRRLARRVRGLTRRCPDQLTQVAAQTGLGGRVALVDTAASFSFVFGMLRPRVAVSSGLLAGLSGEELRAVLEHERYHVCSLDPLRVVLLRALSTALFFLPALGSLHTRYIAARELAADRRAVAACGPRPLVGALLKVVRGPAWSELEVAACVGGPELLDARVTQLETGIEPRLRGVGFARAAISLFSTAVFLATFLASVSGFGGPAAVHRATGTGLATATLLGGLACAAPFAGAGLLAYLLIARHASRALKPSEP